jgi:hypothetical protein
LAKLTSYVDEIDRDHQFGLSRNKSTTDQIFYIRQVLWGGKGSMMGQNIRYFKEACNSVKRKILYNIPLGFVITKIPVSIIKICLNEICSKIRVAKHLSDKFPTQNCLKKGDALSPLLFRFVCFRKCHQGSTT